MKATETGGARGVYLGRMQGGRNDPPSFALHLTIWTSAQAADH
jgi:hypothetical protein